MNRDVIKYFQFEVRIEEEVVLESIIKLFDEANRYIKGSEFYERSR